MEILISKLPDEHAVQGLARHLKGCSPEYALDVIRHILGDENPKVRYGGAKLAAKVIRGAPNFLNLLNIGLARKDISEIRFLLVTVIKAIGVNKVLKHLTFVANESPDWIAFAWYQLVPIIRNEKGNSIERLRDIELITDRALADKTPNLLEFWKSMKSSVDY